MKTITTEEMMFVPGTYEDPDQTLIESLFHVSPSDKDDETGASLEEVILIDFLYHNKELLAKKPLREFIRVYLDEPSKQQ
jgi:hypothetical protein